MNTNGTRICEEPAYFAVGAGAGVAGATGAAALAGAGAIGAAVGAGALTGAAVGTTGILTGAATGRAVCVAIGIRLRRSITLFACRAAVRAFAYEIAKNNVFAKKMVPRMIVALVNTLPAREPNMDSPMLWPNAKPPKPWLFVRCSRITPTSKNAHNTSMVIITNLKNVILNFLSLC